MKIKPLGERVLIKVEKQKEERTKAGLYLPKSDEEKKQGVVIDVGTGKNGKEIPLKKGEKIIYAGYSHEEIEINGEKYVIVDFKDVIAKIEEE